MEGPTVAPKVQQQQQAEANYKTVDWRFIFIFSFSVRLRVCRVTRDDAREISMGNTQMRKKRKKTKNYGMSYTWK